MRRKTRKDCGDLFNSDKPLDDYVSHRDFSAVTN